MAHYSYKDIVNRIPQKYIDEIEDFDYDANYDGHYWIAVNNWVNDLQDEIKAFYYPHPQSLRAEVIRLREALKRISDTPSNMVWGHNTEILEAMRTMEAIADEALKGGTNGN